MIRLLIVTLVLLLPGVVAAQNPSARQAAPGISYSASRIDIGLIVSDLDRAASFYEGALGLQRAYSFDVPGDVPADDQRRLARLEVARAASGSNAAARFLSCRGTRCRIATTIGVKPTR